LLVGFTIITNLIFIPLYGIVGAALATALTKILFNFFRFLFVWRMFKMQPFSWRNLMVVVLATAAYGVSLLIPQLPNFIADIAVRSVVISVIFLPAVYFLKLSTGFNHLVNKYLRLK